MRTLKDWRFPAGMICLAILTGSIGCRQSTTTVAVEQPSSGNATGVVTLEFQFGEEVKRVAIPDVPEGTLLETLMRDLTDPAIDLKGSGGTAFVSQIGEFATTRGEGWTFKIDGEFSHEGVGKTELQPPTTVQWSYGTFDPSAQDDPSARESGAGDDDQENADQKDADADGQ